MFFDSDFDGKPDFVNDQGTKFWKDKASTHYAQTADQHGTTLDVYVFCMEATSGFRTRIIVDADNKLLCYQPSLELLGTRIDMLKVEKRVSKQ